MTASAYLVNFKINLDDLAEVALIWPEIMTRSAIKSMNEQLDMLDEH